MAKRKSPARGGPEEQRAGYRGRGIALKGRRRVSCYAQRSRWHWAPLDEIGRHSYGMYLAHFLLIHFAATAMGQGYGWLAVGWLSVLAGAYLIARALHVLVEQPAGRLTSVLVRYSRQAAGVAA